MAKLTYEEHLARQEKERVERARAWENTPRKLFGHDTAAAEAAGWRFERAKKGYNGNPPAYYAISPTGYRYVWNRCMMHGGADPWEPVGQDSPRRARAPKVEPAPPIAVVSGCAHCTDCSGVCAS